MVERIKDKIKSFLDTKIKEIKKHQDLTQQTALDYAQISKLFPESSFIPFTSWSISPSAILHILNDIVINRRQNIIEFGSGASTIYIARLIQTLNLEAKFYSVEASEEWIQKMKEELILYNLEDVVTLIYAPIKTIRQELCYKEQKMWYDVEAILNSLGNNNEIDLIIVDGPPGGSTPFARYSAIPFLQNRLSTNFAVFLDDAARVEESQIINEWAELLSIKIKHFKRYAYLTNKDGFITTPFKISKS